MAGNLNELIFIKRVKKHPHEGSHGGAWKIAYADFVTAMMAFFLLLWLLNSTSQDQRNAISNYFAPQSASRTTSGAGGVLGGRVLDIEGALTASHATPRIMLGVPQVQPGTEVEIENPKEGAESNSGPLPENELQDATETSMGTVADHDLKSRNEAALGTVPENDALDAREVALARAEETTGTEPLEGDGGSLGVYRRDTQGLMPDGGDAGMSDAEAKDAAMTAAEAAAAEDTKLAEIERKLEERIAMDPVLREYKSNISVERTPEGLRIQAIDDEKREMFPLGSADLLDHTKALFDTVADLVKDQPNKIAISGHTDATPYRGSGGYSNWELSTDRANASRRALMAAGVPENRIAQVVGKADTEPMDATNPEAPINRRISIVIQQDERPRPSTAMSSMARDAWRSHVGMARQPSQAAARPAQAAIEPPVPTPAAEVEAHDASAAPPKASEGGSAESQAPTKESTETAEAPAHEAATHETEPKQETAPAPAPSEAPAEAAPDPVMHDNWLRL